MSDRRFSLGILFQDNADCGLTHDFFAAILNGFKKEAENLGYEITFINTKKDKLHGETYYEHIKAKEYDGVAVICADMKDKDVIDVIESEVPVVTIDEAYNGVCSILSDNAQGIRNLVYYIAEMGHKKIAYIYGDMNTVTALRIKNFKEACDEMRIDVPDEYLRASNYRNLAKTAYETEELLRLPDPPTCIVFPDDYASIAGMNAIKARGLDIPTDISIAAYDGLDIPSRYDPQLTTVRQRCDEIGKVAADKLVELIEHPDTASIADVSIDTDLIKGASVGKKYFA